MPPRTPWLAASLLLAGSILSAQQQPTFRSGVSTVSIYATVRSSEGQLVTDLTKDDFRIKDNGALRDVTVFSREIVPINVVMLLDMSGSISLPQIEWMRIGANAFVDEMLPADRARIGTFGVEIAISPRLTSDPLYLRRVLREEIWPGGNTPLWEAIDQAMTSLPAELERRVVLVLTDGIGGGGYEQARKRVLNEGFLLYAVGDVRRISELSVGGHPMTGTPVSSVGPAEARPMSTEAYKPGNWQIQALSAESGGGFRGFGPAKDAAATMREVAEELHRQYVIGFTPTALDGKLHKLEVDVTRRGMSVQTRKNYLAVVQK